MVLEKKLKNQPNPSARKLMKLLEIALTRMKMMKHLGANNLYWTMGNGLIRGDLLRLLTRPSGRIT